MFANWLRQWTKRSSRTARRSRLTKKRRKHCGRPAVELLEDRTLLTASSETYLRLPLSFEPNRGQSSDQVQFLARGQGYGLFLTSTEAVLVLNKVGSADTTAQQPGESTVLRMQLLGANSQPQVVGLEEQPGRINYFIGSDPTRWRTNIPQYGRVSYDEVYPGVDLIYYGTSQQQLEYDFVVAPGADPGVIRFDLVGTDRVEVDGQGDLVLQTGSGEIRQHRPVVYQELNGVRQTVAGEYVVEEGNRVGFHIGAYDAGKPLVIDPVLSYATYLGGNGGENGGGLPPDGDIAVDAAGNMYVTGRTTSADFPITSGTPQTTFGGNTDAFVVKVRANGTAVVYSTFLGGSGGDNGSGITVDPAGNVYVTGATRGGFPTTTGAYQTAFSGGSTTDAFVAKLNATGSALVYSTYLGVSSTSFGEAGHRIAVGCSGHIYVTGMATAAGFPTTSDALQRIYGGGLRDAFVSVFDPFQTGTMSLVYSTYFGGANFDQGNGIAVDSDGFAYVTGYTSGLPAGHLMNPLQGTIGGSLDIFVAKFNPSPPAGVASLVYSTYLGGNGVDLGRAIAVDGGGNIYITGGTNSPNFPTRNPLPGQGALHGINYDAFVTKLDPSQAPGNQLIYSTYLGGSGGENSMTGSEGGGIAVDGAGNAYVTGETASSDFPTMNPLPGAQGAFNGQNSYVAKLEFIPPPGPGTGLRLVYSTYLGGTFTSRGIAVSDSTAYLTGLTTSASFPTVNPLPGQGTLRGGSDAFIAKIAVGLTVSAMPINPTVDVPFTGIVATFTDADPNAPPTRFTATIAWGDGTSSGGTITQPGGPGTPFEVTGNHPYDTPGPYLLSVKVHDNVNNVDGTSNVNVSRMICNQAEGTIAIHPTDPNRLFAASVTFSSNGPNLNGLFAAFSTDGGANWTPRIMVTGTGPGGDGLPVQGRVGDPKATFDEFGNLFLTYLESTATARMVHVALSTDGGRTFTLSHTINSTRALDQPSISTGAGSVWITYAAVPVGLGSDTGSGIYVASARVTGLGMLDPFGSAQLLPGTQIANFGDIAVGPSGQVLVTYQTPKPKDSGTSSGGNTGNTLNDTSKTWTVNQWNNHKVRITGGTGAGQIRNIVGNTPTQLTLGGVDWVLIPDATSTYDILSETGLSEVFVHLDADGLGAGGFGPRLSVTTTNVGFQRPIPAQMTRNIDAEASLAWDLRSSGLYRGRVYVAYTDAPSETSSDTNIFVRFSDNNGANWSNPVRVNNDTTTRSQFFPSIAVDQTTGKVAVAWYDARNDDGGGGLGDTNRIANDDVQFWAAVSGDGGSRFSPNVQVSVGTSHAADPTLDSPGQPFQYGDYSALVFRNGIVYPVWADNSTALANNPDRPQFDVFAARVALANVAGLTLGVAFHQPASNGPEATTLVNLPVSLTEPTSQTVTVNYAVTGGTATSGVDYVLTSGTLTFAPGETTKNISLTVNDDTLVEDNETIQVALSNPVNATLGSISSHTYTIIDNDLPPPLPFLTINDVNVVEGNSGTVNAIFTVSLNAASSQTVTVQYATANGTATAGSDYTTTTGTLTFTTGQTSQTITVPVSGDVTLEQNETFFLNLTNPVGATLSDAQGLGTILNDDIVPLVINDASVAEGNSGVTNMIFTARLIVASSQSVTVQYATTNTTAIAGQDYTAANGTLTFTPGQTEQTITVAVLGDTTVELEEHFFLNLSNAVGATIIDGQGVGTIVNDDSAPTTQSAIRIGGTGTDELLGVATDPAGNSVATGYFEGQVDFDPGPGVTNLQSAGDHDIYVAKYTPAGALLWARRYGSTSTDRGHHVTVDSNGFVYVSGLFTGAVNFDGTPLTSAGGRDIFLIKLDSAGNVVWARRAGGTGDFDEGFGITVDNNSNVLFTGRFEATASFGSFQLTSIGSQDGFVTKLNSAGTFLWATGIGGGAEDYGAGIVADAAGNAYVAGQFINVAGNRDLHITRLDSATGSVAWFRLLGGPGIDIASSIAIDGGNLLVQGIFSNTVAFSPGDSSFDLTSAGSTDVFVYKLTTANVPIWVRRMGGTDFENAGLLKLDGAGNIFASGSFTGTADFNPGAAVFNLTSVNNSLDAFGSVLTRDGVFVWAGGFGGPGEDLGVGFLPVGTANAVAAGRFIGTADFEPGPGTFNLTSNGGDDGFVARLNLPLVVISSAFSHNQVTVRFSQPLDRNVLNLYDGQLGNRGPADITLVGNVRGPIQGSLVLDPTGSVVIFLVTGVLSPDTYTVTFRSALNGFKTSGNSLLDGNGDGLGGDNFVATFTIAPSSAVFVSAPDIARGPGQPVDIPATSTSNDLPLRLSNGAGVTSVGLDFVYNPALLTITGVLRGLNTPAGANATLTPLGPGAVRINFTSPALSAGPIDFVRLQAQVPNNPQYPSKHILDISNIQINGGSIAALADHGLHVVSYFGDTSGSASYSTFDSLLAMRVATGLDTGFAPHRLVDPRILADITGNGLINSTDANRIQQEAIGLDPLEIPPLPGVIPPFVPFGPDPFLNLPTHLVGRRGETLTVPVNLDLSDGLETADLAISYDPKRLEVLSPADVQLGTLTGDFDLFAVNLDARDGTIRVGLGRSAGPLFGRGSGSVLTITFRIRDDAPGGATILNLRHSYGSMMTQLNEGGLDLIPDPSDKEGDILDGLITIVSDAKPVDVLPRDRQKEPGTERNALLRALSKRSDAPMQPVRDHAAQRRSPIRVIDDFFQQYDNDRVRDLDQDDLLPDDPVPVSGLKWDLEAELGLLAGEM